MSDFAQHGRITTLQCLRREAASGLEEELERLSRLRPIVLVMPCHGDDLRAPALREIIATLKSVRFISEFVVSLNGVSSALFAETRGIFRPLAPRCRFIWNDGPRLREVFRELTPVGAGKGFNVWTAFGLCTQSSTSPVIALQDCDVTTFERGTLSRLCYSAAEPRLGYSFAKLYYSRVSDRLYGRLNRLFLGPLLRALVRVAGHHPLLDFLLSFRYALAGECALSSALARTLPIGPGWELEIRMLCEVFRHAEPYAVCQVAAENDYDHKHRAVDDGLIRTACALGQTVLRELVTEGLTIEKDFRAALRTAFEREAQEAVRRFVHLALINKLPFDADAEMELAYQLLGAFFTTRKGASETSSLPPWAQLEIERPELVASFVDAVESDNASGRKVEG